MKYKIFTVSLVTAVLLLNGCGGGGTSDVDSGATVSEESLPTSTLSVISSTESNTEPVADEKSVTVASGSSVSFTLSGTDADGDALTYHVVTNPIFGTLSGIAPNLTYTPGTNYVGTDSLTYVVNDGKVDSQAVAVNIDVTPNSQITTVTVSGKVTYDRVPSNSNYVGLNYGATSAEPTPYVVVEAVDGSNNTLVSTVTDNNGNYTLDVPQNTTIKIRVRAQMLRSDTVIWDVKVVDNTNSDALYVMEGSYATSGTSDSTRDLRADSGWGISSYTSERTAAPFAMLDSVYRSMEKILSAESNAVFEPLQVNWSINNKAASGDPANGDIGTSYYTNQNLFILGDEDSDTDEYDDHVIAHEWAHYYEDTFSRSDSVGGSHSDGDRLDIRVAFGEGWGNAFSAIALDHPVYFDTFGLRQNDGFNFNMETEVQTNPGWYSEGSIQRIVYDLFDSTNDGDDILSLGFGPIHQVFTGAQKNTSVFTSLFSFITYMKDENPTEVTAIENIVASENIATITDIYGNGRSNLAEETPLYVDLTLGSSLTFCPTYTYGSYNKLGNRKYIRFNVNDTATHTISVQKSNAAGATDPDFYLHDVSSHTLVYVGENATSDQEQVSLNLQTASYLLDVYDYAGTSGACFSVSVN